MNIQIPLTVPEQYKKIFAERYKALTSYNNKTLLFAADHMFEKNLALIPEKFFSIASKNKLTIATQLGFFSRYGTATQPCVIKITGKTETQALRAHAPYNIPINTVEQVKTLTEQGVNTLGIGVTIYLGSQDEEAMLTFASDSINKAHQVGLPAILWCYVRGRAIPPEKTHTYLPLAASIATSLGADFAKLQLPSDTLEKHIDLLCKTKQVAGNTRLLFAGGKADNPQKIIETTNIMINLLKWDGGAIGRNIFLLKEDDATTLTQTLLHLIEKKIDYAQALQQIKPLI